MAGFGRVTFIGEFYNQSIVNVFWYRSTAWLPLQGNPFDDVLAFVDAAATTIGADLRSAHTSDYTLLRAEGVGYDDAFNIVTASPLVRTINLPGIRGTLATNGAATACNIGLRCGEQVNISGIGKSKRNRGYVCVGPLADTWVDSYSHLVDPTFNGALEGLAQSIAAPIVIVAPAVTLTPIRIHEKWLRNPSPIPDLLLWRTYSDVLGYTLPRVAGYRRSRQPEA